MQQFRGHLLVVLLVSGKAYQLPSLEAEAMSPNFDLVIWALTLPS